MDVLFPSAPTFDPNDPDRDGMPHVHIEPDGIWLGFGDDDLFIPAGAIQKNGVAISPGGEHDVNRVAIVILASNVIIREDAHHEEIKINTTVDLTTHLARNLQDEQRKAPAAAARQKLREAVEGVTDEDGCIIEPAASDLVIAAREVLDGYKLA